MYKEILLPKFGTRKKRTIHIPNSELKGIQRIILKQILRLYSVNPHAYAYRKNISIIDAARRLSGKQSILRCDIRDFFPSIVSNRVFGMFRELGFPKTTSHILTALTTYNDAIPQGAPTSPAISNLICRQLDSDLSKLGGSWGLSYLRYSDDLFFFGPGYFQHRKLRSYVSRVVGSHGFKINARKTKFYPMDIPRITLGLVTHTDKPGIPRASRRNIRSVFFKASKNLGYARENLNKLMGYAEWYKCVYGEDSNYIEYRRIILNVKDIKIHEYYSI